MSSDVGRRCGLDPALLWLWHRRAATALIQSLAWEPPHAAGAALKRQKQNLTEKHKLLTHSRPTKSEFGG